MQTVGTSTDHGRELDSFSVPATGARAVERLQYGAQRDDAPRATVIIPTLDGHRRGILARLLEDLHDQTLPRFEVILVIGDARQGRAINHGVRLAAAEVIVTMDDDTLIGTPRLLENLLNVLDEHPDVGMAGASTVVPPDASWFQRSALRQIPRRLFPVVSRVTDSDMVQHPCLAMRRELFLTIGGEDEALIRGLDPILRHKVRQSGHRVVIAPHTYISHLLPESCGAVARMYFRNGRGSAFAQRHHPTRVLNLGYGHEGDAFPARVSFGWRVARYPARLAGSLLSLRWIKLLSECAYVCGFLREYLRPRGGEFRSQAASEVT